MVKGVPFNRTLASQARNGGTSPARHQDADPLFHDGNPPTRPGTIRPGTIRPATSTGSGSGSATRHGTAAAGRGTRLVAPAHGQPRCSHSLYAGWERFGFRVCESCESVWGMWQ